MKPVTIVLAFLILLSCSKKTNTSGKGKVAKHSKNAIPYGVDVRETVIGWKGSKVITGSHKGTLKASKGTIWVEKNLLLAGSFVIDMTTIKNTDLEDADTRSKLEAHLKSPDFFNVDSFSTSTFEITKSELIEGDLFEENTHRVSGNLTIKGITHEITFPANVTVEENKITATAKTEINRLAWNIMWGNENDNAARAFLKENFLSNVIELDIKLVANKK